MDTTAPNDASSTGVDQGTLRRDLLLSLEKVLRSYRLYEARGNQYDAHLAELASKAALATEGGQVEVQLCPFGPFLPGDPPPVDGEFARQWFSLFEEGARQIVFQPGIGRSELRELLHILSAEGEEGEDIVTSLWRKELKHVQILVARLLVRGVGFGEEKVGNLEDQYGRWKTGLHAGASLRTGADAVQLSPDDFRILALDENGFDWCRLSAELSAASLEDRLKPKVAAAADKEIEDFERFLDLSVALEDDADETILAVLAGMIRMGMSKQLDRLICAVAEHPELKGRSLQRLLGDETELSALVPLVEFEPSAFRQSVAALAKLDANAAAVLVDNVDEAALAAPPKGPGKQPATPPAGPLQTHSSRLQSADAQEALDAVAALVSLETDEAFLLALAALDSPHAEVRRAVQHQLFANYDETLSHTIPRVLGDPDKTNRILAVRYIGQDGGPQLLRQVMTRMKDRDFARRDVDERIAFVRAIARHSRLPVINQFLCKLLLGFRVFSGKTIVEFQTEVARQVARNPSQEAQQTIKKVLSGWSVPSEVKQAIRDEQMRLSMSDTLPAFEEGEGEIMSIEDDEDDLE